jgi:rSAM/selenodomain-associated transferase 1
MSDCILFFVKYPEPGAVKTRLAEGSSPELAAAFYQALVEDKLAELDGLAQARYTELIVCYAPLTAGADMERWLGTAHRLLPQKGSDLGRRMENGFREAFFMGHERVVLAGSDIPGLTPEIIRQGLEGLTPDRAVIGPAEDGGYYLIGFHRAGFAPGVFRDMAWSEGSVYRQTLARLAEAGLAWTELAHLDDLDTLEDLQTMVALGRSGPLRGRLMELAVRLAGL